MNKYTILDDFNTDFLDNPSKHLLDILNIFQLHQSINSPTRITETTSSCLDLIITQSPRIMKNIDILPAFCSDHNVPYAVLQQHRHQSHRFKRTIYNYKKNLTKTNFVIFSNVRTGRTFLKKEVLTKAHTCLLKSS